MPAFLTSRLFDWLMIFHVESLSGDQGSTLISSRLGRWACPRSSVAQHILWKLVLTAKGAAAQRGGAGEWHERVAGAFSRRLGKVR